MKHLLLCLVVFIFSLNEINAQVNSVYVEFQGATYGSLENTYYGSSKNLWGFSLNYELRFTNSAVRIGVGRTIYENQSKETNPYFLAVPIEYIFISNGESHFIEGGLFITGSFGDRFYDSNYGTKYPDEYVHFNFDLSPGLQLGYRFQPENMHLIGRVNLTIMHLSKYYNFNENFESGQIHFGGGISLGYVF